MPYSLKVEPRDSIDSKWYNELQRIVGSLTEIYFALAPPPIEMQQLEASFIASDYNLDIDLRSTQIHAAPYELAIERLAELSAKITAHEHNIKVAQAYNARISELQSNSQILLSVSSRDGAGFCTANSVVYGKPDQAIFAATCHWLQVFAKQQLGHPDGLVRKTAQRVVDNVPSLLSEEVSIVPSISNFEKIRSSHFAPAGYIEQLFAGTSMPKHIETAVGDQQAKIVLANIGSTYTLSDASDVFWGVKHSGRTIVRPAKYDLPVAEFRGILAHELGSHLLERLNGLRQPLRLLATGLDRYEAGNEGRAYLREQIMYSSPHQVTLESSWEHIITLHYAISLAEGLNGHMYTFSEIYAALLPISLLFESLRHDNADLATENAHRQSWVTTTRILKGTAGNGNGAYLKDIVYLEGNVRCWQIAEERPELILYGDYGKFDIARADHVELLQSLDILPHF